LVKDLLRLCITTPNSGYSTPTRKVAAELSFNKMLYGHPLVGTNNGSQVLGATISANGTASEEHKLDNDKHSLLNDTPSTEHKPAEEGSLEHSDSANHKHFATVNGIEINPGIVNSSISYSNLLASSQIHEPYLDEPVGSLTLHPVPYMGSNVNLFESLAQFRCGKSHMAVIIDTKNEGKVLGILTMEDIIEELIQSEIFDESDLQRFIDKDGFLDKDETAVDIPETAIPTDFHMNRISRSLATLNVMEDDEEPNDNGDVPLLKMKNHSSSL